MNKNFTTSCTLGHMCCMAFVRHSWAKGAIGTRLNPVNIGFAYFTNSPINSLCVKQGKEQEKSGLHRSSVANDGLNSKSKTCDKR